MFETRYSCDVVIQIRKYNENSQLMRDPLQSGAMWTALHIDPTIHYEPMVDVVKDLTFEKRLEIES